MPKSPIKGFALLNSLANLKHAPRGFNEDTRACQSDLE